MRNRAKTFPNHPFRPPLQNCGRPLWVKGGKTPSEYMFSESPQITDIVRSAFHHSAHLLVLQITAF